VRPNLPFCVLGGRITPVGDDILILDGFRGISVDEQ
jgi:hypothetical protein